MPDLNCLWCSEYQVYSDFCNAFINRPSVSCRLRRKLQLVKKSWSTFLRGLRATSYTPLCSWVPYPFTACCISEAAFVISDWSFTALSQILSPQCKGQVLWPCAFIRKPFFSNQQFDFILQRHLYWETMRDNWTVRLQREGWNLYITTETIWCLAERCIFCFILSGAFWIKLKDKNNNNL